MCVFVCMWNIHHLHRLTNTFTYLTRNSPYPYLPYSSPVGNFPLPFGFVRGAQVQYMEKVFLRRAKTVGMDAFLESSCTAYTNIYVLNSTVYNATLIEESCYHSQKEKILSLLSWGKVGSGSSQPIRHRVRGFLPQQKVTEA